MPVFVFLEEGEDENPRGFDPKLFEVVNGSNLDRFSEPRSGAYRDVKAQSLPLLQKTVIGFSDNVGSCEPRSARIVYFCGRVSAIPCSLMNYQIGKQVTNQKPL